MCKRDRFDDQVRNLYGMQTRPRFQVARGIFKQNLKRLSLHYFSSLSIS